MDDRVELREQLAPSAARGAAWLDGEYPLWYLKIDLDRLQMIHSCRCILGQLYADYNLGKRILGLCSQSAAELGFILVGAHDNNAWGWETLDEVWIDEVKKRVAEQAYEAHL